MIDEVEEGKKKKQEEGRNLELPVELGVRFERRTGKDRVAS